MQYLVDQNWVEQAPVSPTHRTLGRQTRVIEPSITPSTTPIPSTSEDTSRASTSAAKPLIKSIDKIVEIGSPELNSPESPLSRMNVMPNPPTNSVPIPENIDGLISPKSVTQLEFPTPERLLPIGQHAKDGINTLADKVREVLSIGELSHLKQESSFEKSEVCRTLTF